jgi:four helix bundle protein
MRDFKKLMIWQLGMEIVDKVYDVVSSLPADERYGMRSQMTRSAISIPSNIAEGSAKKSERDYRRYVEISLGSAFELETHSLVVQRRGWVKDDLILELLDKVKSEQKMLTKFIEKIEGN